MRVFVFVNSVREIGARQTTALLIAAFNRHGCEVWLADVDGISFVDDEVIPRLAVRAVRLNESIVEAKSVSSFSERIQIESFSRLSLTKDDLVLIRTNPGRDQANNSKHRLFLELAQIAQSLGVRVVNDPVALSFLASKAAITLLPKDYRPQMLVTHQIEAALEFVSRLGRECVIKPLLGSRGENVIRVQGPDKSLREDLETRFGNQSVVVQAFVDSAEVGDKRVVVFDGAVMEHEGKLAGIHRIPAAGDFRANLHAGGKAEPLSLNSEQHEAVRVAASLLQKHGVRLAGIDLIGTKIIEFNVFSTGGLFDANQFADFDFTDGVASALCES